MRYWNDSFRERSIRHAFKEAGIPKKHCRVHVESNFARVCVYTSLGHVRGEAMRELLYRIDLFTKDDCSILITEGRRYMPRIIIECETSDAL